MYRIVVNLEGLKSSCVAAQLMYFVTVVEYVIVSQPIWGSDREELRKQGEKKKEN